MIRDFDRHPDACDFRADVCIAGAGAAGLTLARQLLARGRRVCLVESGGLDFAEPVQSLYGGDNTGMPYYELDQSRLRFFGGTTNIWGGRCAVLDPLDMASRPWVAHSGWPLDTGELMFWCEQVHREMGLGEFDYDADDWLERVLLACGAPPEQLGDCGLQARLWRFDRKRERFGWRQCRDLLDSPDCRVIIRASVTGVEVNEAANRVTALRLGSLGGREGRIRAEHFVLACGGIENARLLLLSDEVETTGVGNRHDQVGRYFMEHPHGRIGRIRTPHAWRLWQGLRKTFSPEGPPRAPALVLSEREQARNGALNSAVTLKLQRDPELGMEPGRRLYQGIKHRLNPDRAGRRAHHWYRELRDWWARTLSDAAKHRKVRRGREQLYLIIRGEQAPNPGSRVRLSRRRDELGCRRVSLHWQLSEQDKHTARVMAEVFDRELRRLDLGHVEPAAWLREPGNEWPVDPTVGNHPIGGYHHMGTTRMSDDPRQGVVDRDCRVHGYGNLHIAGSSVFPTAGWANPTLTILALAHRLAQRLDRELQGAQRRPLARSGEQVS